MLAERWPYRIRLLLRSLFRRTEVERELDDEIRYHLEQQVALNIAAGMSEDEAHRAARRAFGNVEVRKEYCRDHWVVAAIDRLGRDLRHALRSLGREPSFTAGVLLLLALGVGANVAVFSIVNGVLLKPLPYPEPDRLMVVAEAIPQYDESYRSVNGLHFAEWTACRCFEDIALSEYAQQINLARPSGDPERVPYMRVTPNLFSVLGVTAQTGRTLIPEDADPGGEKNVLISDRLWRSQFGSDPDIVGKTVDLDAAPFTIVGVLPPGFRYHASRNTGVDVYLPWNREPQPWWRWTNNYSYGALARLADGVSPEAALAELDAIQARIADEHFTGDSASLDLEAKLIPYHDWITVQSRAGLYLLLAAVGAAFLVACLNIANLMLVRATARSREAGIRSALGATRLAIFRSVFIESALLALAGAAGGVVLAVAALGAFRSLAATMLPRVDALELDWFVLVAAIGLTVVAMLIFGLFPALRLTRVDPERALESGGRSSTDSAGRMRGRQVLVSVEVGLSVMLMIVVGLLVASFLRIDATERGFDSTNVVTGEVSLPYVRYRNGDGLLRFWNALRRELTAAPGVVDAGFTSVLPLRGNFFGSTAIREGEAPPAEEQPSVQYRFISEGYLAAMGIPLLRGRYLTEDDYARNSAVISERTARLLWGDENPIGRRFHWNDPGNLFEVVGVVPDVPSIDLETEPTPIVYRPLTGTGDGNQVTSQAAIALRMSGSPESGASILRRAVASLDKEVAISRLQTMDQIESASVGERRFQLYLVGTFGVASLLIAALGIYSVLAYAVSARLHELAMRMALGARSSSVFSLVLKQGMRPVLVGILLGVAGAIAAGRMLSSLLFGVSPTDATTIVTVVAVTLGAALLASVLPARRAAGTSVLRILRYE
jgi:putative ABC transport system permease protein